MSVSNLSLMNLHVNASVDAIRIQGLDDLKVLSLSAADSSTLSLDVGVGADFAVEVDVSFALLWMLSMHTATFCLRHTTADSAVESMKIRLALPNGRISTDSLHALVDATSLAALDVRHLMSSPSCIMSTFASARLGGLTLLSNNATLEIQCKTGGSVSSFNSGRYPVCTEGFAKLSALLAKQAPQAQLVSMIGRLILDAVDAKMGQPVVHLLKRHCGKLHCGCTQGVQKREPP